MSFVLDIERKGRPRVSWSLGLSRQEAESGSSGNDISTVLDIEETTLTNSLIGAGAKRVGLGGFVSLICN